jgi:UPF0755 protein
MAAVSMLEQEDHRDVGSLDWDDEDDFVTVRSGGYRVLRVVFALVVLVVIGFLLYRGVRGWFDSQLDPSGEAGETVMVVIPAGSSSADIAEQLEVEGIVPNSTFFRYYADWKGEGNFQAGEYQMQLNSSVDEAIAVLNAGPAPEEYARFGVPEGLWLSEMLPRIAEQLPAISVEQLQAVLDSGQLQPRYRPDGQASWEGLLFPAFYEIEDDAEPIEVLAKMNDEFARVTSELGYGAADTALGLNLELTAYDVIIVASMVEAEAKVDEDRAKIARVIYNNLEQGNSLGIDATCLYGLRNRQAQYDEEAWNNLNGYECRNNRNLPPTPIAMPGRASLEAAIRPAEGPWLYYVLMDADGHHFFTDDYDAFLEQKAISDEAGLLG